MPAGWLRGLFIDAKNRLRIADTATGLRRPGVVNADRLNFTRYPSAAGLSSIGVLFQLVSVFRG